MNKVWLWVGGDNAATAGIKYQLEYCDDCLKAAGLDKAPPPATPGTSDHDKAKIADRMIREFVKALNAIKDGD